MSLYEFHIVKIQNTGFFEESPDLIVMNNQGRFLDSLTARQYGEVVLPDASIRAESWYFSQKAVTVQGGYGAVFAVMVQILLSAGAIAVQV